MPVLVIDFNFELGVGVVFTFSCDFISLRLDLRWLLDLVGISIEGCL